ncbi:hypothetical protein LJR219_001502 [Phenylobacterium sp. LjRoot219]|uniref:hypothetical protein n=1 Tax=Phenylobacterium sp. LjRoot219 TaxID=3342283 RepID=UPI003ED01BD2
MPDASASHLSALRCALTGAAVLAVLYAVCWAAAAAGFTGGSHMYISIFTLAPVASLAALGIGLCWSVAFGAVTGALIAATYNVFSFAEHRGTSNQRSLRA